MRNTHPPRRFAAGFSRWVAFLFLSAALICAVIDEGGRAWIGWNICSLVIAAGTLSYVFATWNTNDRPIGSQMLQWALLLPCVYVAFQLVPLPLPLLRLLSPAQASLVESLKGVGNAPSFASLSIDPETTIAFFVRTLAYALSAFVISEICLSWRAGRSWLWVVPLIGIGAFEGCLGIIQSTAGADVVGTYRSKDHFAGCLEMILPLAAACGIWCLKPADTSRRLPVSKALKACVAFGCAAIMLAGLVYSLSKMGFAAGLGGLFVMSVVGILPMFRGPKQWAALTGVAVAVLLVFTLLPTARLASGYADFFSQTPSTVEGRAPIWSESRQLLADYPIVGTGLGTFGIGFLKYQNSAVDYDYPFAHNDYLQSASELGILGLLMFGALLATALATAVRAGCSEDWNTRLLGLGCTGALAAIGIHSLVDFNLYIPANALILSWIVGITISLARRQQALASHSNIAREPASAGPYVTRSFTSVAPRALATLFGCALAIYAAGWLLLETKYQADPTARQRFCRIGICETNVIVAADAPEDTSSDSTASSESAVANLQKHIASPTRWCDLGEAFLKEGKLKEARYCFSKATALAPNIPPVLLRSAKFYHAVHEDAVALKLSAHVLATSSIFHDSVLDWYLVEKFSVNQILCSGLPQVPQQVQAYLRYWIKFGNLDNARITWAWITAHHFANVSIVRDYIGFLFESGKYEEASTAWGLFLGNQRGDYRKSNWLFNGDFESEPSGIPFDWQIGSVAGQADADIDSKVAYTGSHSLRIHFAGTENANYAETMQKTSVPAGTYRFTGFIRTEGITTDKGIAFHIFDPQGSARLNIQSTQFVGTNGWTKVEQIFVVPAATHLVEIQVVREPTLKFDNKIRGTAWIDDLSLSRI